ncbi:Serine/threonine-protein kinase Sgk2 [Coemansia aciculifera]|uniref:Serine/threonine-protein kinase Sgk2 n=1 Tax=Coemansia aciculifera TaxID=417176 RepID=A0A9W8M2G9_9FUNG|nr:Serine/threonine-protein kinase Sgk2 [Coemansia aciculifera]
MDTTATPVASSASSASGAIPTVLRQLLTKGGGGSRQHAAQIVGIVHPSVSKPAPTTVYHPLSPQAATYGQRTLVGSDSPMPSARASLDMGAARRTHRTSDAAPGRASGNGIGAWLSKYSLRGGSNGSRTSVTSTTSTASSVHTRNASAEIARHSIDSTLAAMQLSGVAASQAFAALITAIEIRDNAGSSSASLRVGRKQRSAVVYRILVSGRDGHQWWVVRAFAEFHDLHALIRRRFAHVGSAWADLFPTKRWSASTPAPQSADRLNVFLRAITADADVCACDDVQRFLKDNSATVAMSPVSDDGHAHFDPSHRMPLPDAWASGSHHSPGRDSMVRVSMPVLKDHYHYACVAQTATPPTSGPRHLFEPALHPSSAAAPPVVPPRPAKHQSMGVDHPKSPLAAVIGEEAAAMQVLRKASDSLLYVSAEKRPNIEPLTMRKKYGLRGNLQYINGSNYHQDEKRSTVASEQGPEPKESICTIDDDIEADNEDHGAHYHPREVTLVASPISQYSSQQKLPPMSKSKTWGAATAQSHGGGDHDSEDIEMASSDQQMALSQTQLQSPPLQSLPPPHRPLASSASFMKGNVNTLMTTLAIEQQQLLSPPPLWSAPATAQSFGDDVHAAASPSSMMSQKRVVGLDDFQLLSIIGKGSYGKVMLARYKDTGKVMAIKVISKSKLRGRPNEIRRVMSERKVLERTVRHPFLVGLQCAFQTKEKLFFCLDYVNGGELFFHLQRERRFSENRARFYAAEITSALEYLHGIGVVYRDLKPENCLLDADGHVKIVDFGLAKEVGPVVWRTEGSALYSVEEGGKTGTFCGTPEYLAPEVLLRQRYGKDVDWYCLGAVLYEMLTGLPPFYDQDNNTMYQRILSEDLRFPATLPPPLKGNGSYNDSCGSVPGASIGKLAQDFIMRILERDPQKRLGHGVFGTENVKRHVFFHGIDWDKIYRQEYAPPFVPKVSSIFDLSNIDPEFRNEPIPQSILMEGQVDIIAEAAEAERQAELAMQAQLMAFPSPLTTPVAAFSPVAAQLSAKQLQHSRMGVSSPPNSINLALRDSYASTDSNGDAFHGFAFVSPWVDVADDQ